MHTVLEKAPPEIWRPRTGHDAPETERRPPSLLVRGSANIDEFFSVPHIVKPGETIASVNFSRRAGGKGANTAVGCARAGAKVTFVSTIGLDGAIVKQALLDYKVDVTYLGEDQQLPTGRAIIQRVNSSGENSIVLLSGANGSTSVALPDLSSYDGLMLQNEIPLEETRKASEIAHLAGLVIFFNPSPMPTPEELRQINWSTIDWLILNEDEALALSTALAPSERVTATSKKDLATLEGLPALADCKGFIITLGAKGVEASVKSGNTRQRVKRPAGHVRGVVKDTTGAGDCFTSYFASLLLQTPNPKSPTEHEILSVLRIAAQAAAMCVEKEGALDSYPALVRVKLRSKELGGEWPDWLE